MYLIFIFLLSDFIVFNPSICCLCTKMNYVHVYVANNDNFYVVRLDEILTKTFVFFFNIHLLIFIFICNFLYHHSINMVSFGAIPVFK